MVARRGHFGLSKINLGDSLRILGRTAIAAFVGGAYRIIDSTVPPTTYLLIRWWWCVSSDVQCISFAGCMFLLTSIQDYKRKFAKSENDVKDIDHCFILLNRHMKPVSSDGGKLPSGTFSKNCRNSLNGLHNMICYTRSYQRASGSPTHIWQSSVVVT